MKTTHWLLKSISKPGLLLLMMVSTCVDAGIIGDMMNWKEEVMLHDGQIIIAERSYNLGDNHASGGDNLSALEETVTFNLPDSRKIVWNTNFRDTEPEPNSLNLILFDVVKSVPYIATYPADCKAYNKWKRPNPPQIFFKYENKRWKRTTLKKFPLELKEANVIVGRPDMQNLKGFYTVRQIKIENNNIHAPEYRTVLRKTLTAKKCPKNSISLKSPVKKAPRTPAK